MDLDALKEMLSDFDINTLVEKLIPKLDTVLGWVVLLTRIAVMAAPLLILGFGLLYLLTPPKEANYSVGYRFWWGMSSLDAWRFTQRLAGMVWSLLGLVLTIVISVLSVSLADREMMDMLWYAAKCIGWELAFVVLSRLIIDVTVVIVFDRRGYRRRGYIK